MKGRKITLRHGSLFSGIGGFDLAAEWMGWTNVFHCELNPFCQRVLKYYYPKALSYEDIKKTDFSKHRGEIDILTGGFPCQPYSLAGKRLGKEDERHLWPDMLRAVQQIRPRWVVGENVLGIVSWNGGMVFEEVHLDLEALGYHVQPFVLPAAGVNAPHRRDRVWFVAHSDNPGFQKTRAEQQAAGFKQHGELDGFINKPNRGKVTGSTERSKRFVMPDWQSFPTQPPVCTGNDGISMQLDGITFSKWRTESIKAGGNAIVPQVAYQLFRAIELTDRQYSKLHP